MGGAVSSGKSNEDLIWKLKQAGYIETPLGEVLMKLVDRRFYVVTDEATLFYRDTAWQQDDLHMSAPCIYAEVTGIAILLKILCYLINFSVSACVI